MRGYHRINLFSVILITINVIFFNFAESCDPFEIGASFQTARQAMIKGMFNPDACLCKDPCTVDKMSEHVKFDFIKTGDDAYHRLNSEDPSASELYNFKGPVKFLIHGYTEKATVGWMMPTGKKLAQTFHGYVILVDHGSISGCAYAKTVHEMTHTIGSHVVKLIKKFHFDPHKIELIGHSVGAHLAGCIGAEMHGAIGKITGLDPAGIMYDRLHIGLNNSCAHYVQVLHTDPGDIGTALLRGHADFFANRKSFLQPGCRIKPCGHAKAVYYYYASLFPQNKFIGRNCNNPNSGDTNVFGEGGRGVFCFRTTQCFPYVTDNEPSGKLFPLFN